MTDVIEVEGVIFKFVRRRYNGRKTFTWLHYQDENDQWQEYRGDPWPSVKIPKHDLVRIARELKDQVAPELQCLQVCELFDVTILTDYWLGTDEHPELGHALYALGQRADLSAGLRGFRMTPFFDSEQGLYAFCRRNFAKFRDYARENPDAAAPDTTNWQ